MINYSYQRVRFYRVGHNTHNPAPGESFEVMLPVSQDASCLSYEIETGLYRVTGYKSLGMIYANLGPIMFYNLKSMLLNGSIVSRALDAVDLELCGS